MKHFAEAGPLSVLTFDSRFFIDDKETCYGARADLLLIAEGNEKISKYLLGWQRRDYMRKIPLFDVIKWLETDIEFFS